MKQLLAALVIVLAMASTAMAGHRYWAVAAYPAPVPVVTYYAPAPPVYVAPAPVVPYYSYYAPAVMPYAYPAPVVYGSPVVVRARVYPYRTVVRAVWPW